LFVMGQCRCFLIPPGLAVLRVVVSKSVFHS
jgi:hypothetical protein